MKPFGWISVVYMLDEKGEREGIFKRSRMQRCEEDARRCVEEWRVTWAPWLTDAHRYEFTAEKLFTGSERT